MELATAITGTGLVSCLGGTVDSTFRAMVDGQCGIRTLTRMPLEGLDQNAGGELPDDLFDALCADFPDDDPAVAMAVTAGREALAQAALLPHSATSGETALILATNFGPIESLEWCWREQRDYGTADPATLHRFTNVLERTAGLLGCTGPRTQITMSCASGAAALTLARRWIQTGRAQRVLAIGYDALTEFCWCGLANLRTITTGPLRPFDTRRSGTVFSEGAAAVVLETNALRRARPAPLLAALAGAAVNNNAFHMTAPPMQAEGSRRVLAAALADAGIPPERVDHVSAHATGTRANDVTEAAALRNLLGDHLGNVTIAAHKSQLGHMLGAAGLAEAVITVEAIRRGTVPPTVHADQPDPECDPLDVVRTAPRTRAIRCALTNSAGIGGNNAALVLVRADDPETP